MLYCAVVTTAVVYSFAGFSISTRTNTAKFVGDFWIVQLAHCVVQTGCDQYPLPPLINCKLLFVLHTKSSIFVQMVADLVQSYKSMGFHTWYGGRSLQSYRSMGCHSDMVADPVQSYRSMVPYVIWWSILHNPIDLWGVKWYGGLYYTILQIYGVSYVIWWSILYNPMDLWSLICDMVADPVNPIDLWGVIRDMMADPIQSYRSMGCHTWYGGRSRTILQIYGVSYVIWWPILYNPTDLWGVIRDMVANPVQFYRSMGCHTWYGGRFCTILQIYGGVVCHWRCIS